MTTPVRRERIARLLLAAVLLAITALIVVVVLSYHDWRPQPIDRVDATSTGTSIELTVSHNWCGEDLRASIRQQSDTNVTVRVEQDVSGDCEDIGLESTYTVELDEPLGDRTITGEPSIRTCVIDGGASDRCRSAESG